MANMNKTWPDYKTLEPKQRNGVPIQTQPIPFFGDIENARVLTVGVNPSATEFDPLRWPDQVPVNELKDRLIDYYELEQVKPDKWFNTWTDALKHLKASYQADAAHLAAHIDLSPRVTKSMGSVDPYDFLTMVKADAKWFFELVQECKAARLMLMSGTVTKCYYMDDFVTRIANEHGFELKPLSLKGEGFKFYRLHGPGVDLPVFFSSVSPSGGKRRDLLIQRVEENKEKLLDLMSEQPAPATT